MTWVTSGGTVSNHRGFRQSLAVGRLQENPGKFIERGNRSHADVVSTA